MPQHPRSTADVDTIPHHGEQYLRFLSKKAGLVTAEQERQLAKRIAQGDDRAKQELAQSNLRLVVSIAKKYLNLQKNRCDLEFLDVIQEGNVGLMKAVERFDYRRGHRFSTYASWWIKQSVKKVFSENDRPIRLPGHVIDDIARLKRAKTQLEEELGAPPTVDQLAQYLGLSVKKITRLEQTNQKVLSLDAPQAQQDGNAQTLQDILESDQETPEADYEKKTLLTAMDRALNEDLQERERQILLMRFGFESESEKKMALEDIGVYFGVTRECIRQSEIRALKKLRAVLH